MSDPGPQIVRRRRGTALLLAALALLVLTALGLWLARKPIASDLIDRELARRGVPARYAVKQIGLRTQRLERLSIGDTRAPDLTASWVEVDVRPTFGAPEIIAIRASGVRLRGRLVGGRLRLGAVERLLPKQTGKPFSLPDLPIALSDARLALATPAGPLSLRLEGRGNLANGFAGTYLAAAPALAFGGCTLSDLALRGRVSTRAGRPRFAGPTAARALGCPDASIATLSGTIDATLEPALDGWRGAASLAGGPGQLGGWSAIGARGQADFAGNAARTTGALRLAALELSGVPGRAERAELGGRYVLESARPEQLDRAATRASSIRFEGGLTGTRVTLADAPQLGGFARSVAGTPLQPLARAFAEAASDLGRNADLRASLSLATRGGEGALRIGSGELAGSDAMLRFIAGEGVRMHWPGPAKVQVDGSLTLTGAGVPRVAASLRQTAPGARISGVARMAPYQAQGTRVVLAPVRFESGRFVTRLEASGPLLGGEVQRAALPLTGSFGVRGITLNTDCAPLSFERLTVSGLQLQPAMLRLCPLRRALVDDGRVAGRIDQPRLQGALGASPITLAATGARFEGSRFTVTGLAARLGGAERLSRLEIARLSGAPGNGVAGRFSGASGQIGNVPLIVSDGAGRWQFSGGTLTASGALGLADEGNRFNPLTAPDFSLRIRGSKLVASADLLEPRSQARLVKVALRHDLSTGTGGADLDVAQVRFVPEGLQPEQITRLTLGVVADVEGTLAGRGRIDWNSKAVTSSGRFRMEAASLAAPFGPATGIATDIVFTDLLGLETGPGQTLTVATVNPGILVENGMVSYRLAPDLKVAIESGRWPFAGGTLSLRPTILDFSEDAARNLTFDIQGMDAARFVNALQFSNINAAGIFDGTLPMVFDQDGGRVVGGNLISRAPGGTLSYVGEVSNANLGIWGGIAFDALKSIQYQNMTIALDGRIDGEMLSQIRFAGVSRGTIKPIATGLIARVGGQLASELQRLPFIFNIRIRAPFRGLIAMARSFDDPSLLIEDRLGPGFETTVQPSESGNKR